MTTLTWIAGTFVLVLLAYLLYALLQPEKLQ